MTKGILDRDARTGRGLRLVLLGLTLVVGSFVVAGSIVPAVRAEEPSGRTTGADREPGATPVTGPERPSGGASLPGDGSTTPGERQPDAGSVTHGESKAGAWSPVVYIPPGRGSARQTAGAGTRTFSRGDVTVKVLAPRDHIALTTRAQPILYWYVSQDTALRVDVTLVDEEAIDPLLEWTVPGPIARGIHALDLAERGITLEPERTYRWHVAIVRDEAHRANDTFAEGFIARTAVPVDLARRLDEAPQRFAPYALSGIWYDAMHELLRAIERDPEDKRLRLQRAALLEQAGLEEVAVYALRAGR